MLRGYVTTVVALGSAKCTFGCWGRNVHLKSFKPRGGISEAHYLECIFTGEGCSSRNCGVPFSTDAPLKKFVRTLGFAKSAKFGSLCAFQAAFHEHLKTAAFVDAVGLGLSNLVPKCQEADGNQKGTETTSLIWNFPSNPWRSGILKLFLVVWSLAVWIS